MARIRYADAVSAFHAPLSDDFDARTWQPKPADGKAGRRWLAMGDPQTTFEKVLQILDDQKMLDERGWLRAELGLVSIGDHFDFKSDKDVADVGRDGANILRWLAEHPPDQVVILMGNHDAARVMELAFESDESFAGARALAAACVGQGAAAEAARHQFARAYPRIPTPEIAFRDYSSFAVHQRALVQKLLLAGRMRLACAGHRAGTPVLLTHAGVTELQVKELSVQPRADALAAALETRLHAAVERVREAWDQGERAALDLRPLHFAGQAGREGGGLLYHRASSRQDESGPAAPVAPRRFHPNRLPRGLVQVCGHTGHHKCLEELADWLGPSASARAHGGLRTLSAGHSRIVYEANVEAASDKSATVYLIDIEMNSPKVTDYPLLELDRVDAASTTAVTKPASRSDS
jgi:hypothetical protein